MCIPPAHDGELVSSDRERQGKVRNANVPALARHLRRNLYTSGRSLPDSASRGRASQLPLARSGRIFSAVSPVIEAPLSEFLTRRSSRVMPALLVFVQ